jgi:Tol biopolymer transport system component
MLLSAGTRLGLYEIVAPLGAGGMGEVYRARDTKLGRSVAVKILPEAFALDPDRLARFEREAKVLASLNHPHITALHGMEESGGRHFLVMELVEGETLADAISERARGPGARRGLEIDDALTIARQIADALEAAHEQGIIHRDLKPANIKLRPDGTVKVLDFGLAKALEPTSSIRGDVTSSPTITTPAMTQLGIILGTAAYMSPEQAKGRPADKRSDVWAFGCVLFEMLTGRRAFEGEDVSDTLATVLKGEPDWTALPANLPDGIRALVQGCLRKDRRERIGDLSTARFLLNQPPVAKAAALVTPPLPRSVWKRALSVVGGVLIGAAVATAVLVKLKTAPTVAVTRFVITLPPGQQLMLPRQAVNISPDGARIVYAADGRLYVRSMSEVEPRAIPGADPAINPVFSPDGQSLAFWADGSLKRITINGGAPVTICHIGTAPSGIVWIDNAILFGQAGTGIMRVSADGGDPHVVVALSPTEALGHGPQMLPDGDTLLFTVAERVQGIEPWDNAHIVVQSLKTGARKTIVEKGTDARFVPTGHIVYAIGGTLFAVPFDPGRLAAAGGPVPIVEGVGRVTAVTSGGAHFAFSSSGSLVYVAGPASIQQNLMLFDRKGGSEALKLPPGSYTYPRVSPDGKQVAFETGDRKEANIAIFELSGASSVRRLTFGGNNRYPIWSGDGRRVAFQSDREGAPAVFWQAADGGIAERLTTADPGTFHVPESWSPTGDTLLFSVKKGLEWSLWTFSIRERKAMPFRDVKSMVFPTDAAFSPDGRWVAYQIGEQGAGEATTYVEPFPPTGTKYQVARGGRPQWSRDGSELFYVPAPSQFMAVTVRTQPSLTFANPVAVPRRFGIADPANARPYDITADGRIVGLGSGVTQSGLPGPAQIQVVLNWFEELKARAPTK